MATLLNDCGCCEGITSIVPAEVFNRPGQPQVRYRAGIHGEFLTSALAALSDPGFAALGGLTTRDPNDFTIALLDSWAVVADVLTFYQERIANESYLRTATERQSILELARLIGYTLRPGVAASIYLAFTLEDSLGAPKRTTIHVGTKVQSIPGPGEQPQIFETIEAIDARAEWNALRPQTTRLIVPGKRDKSTYLRGLATNLRPGDALLFVGTEREADPKNENWDFRLLKEVRPDEENGRTRVTWEEGLGDSPHTVPADNPRVYAFRQRAAIFGYNAPEWRTIPDTTKALYLGLDDPRELIDEVLINGVPYSEKKEWPNFTIFAPTSTPKPQPVPDREIQPTRESVAAAATAAAAIQVAIAVKLASDAANDAEAAAQTAQNAVQPAITAAEAAATIPLHTAIVAAKNAVAAANADSEMNAARDDILDQALGLVPNGLSVLEQLIPGAAAALPKIAADVYAAKRYEIPGLKSDSGGGQNFPSDGITTWDLRTQRTNIDTNLQKIADTIKTAADLAIDNAETDIQTNAIPAAAQAAFAPLTALISAAQTFATKAREAAAVTQTAVIIATLIKAVLELPENLRPPDANTMAIVIDAIADLAADATFRGASLTSSLAGLSPQANAALYPVAAAIKATNLGSAVKTDAENVRDAVKKAVVEALKPVKLPRPARRDIFEPYQDTIDLDAIYQRITPESWLILSIPTYQEVYKVKRVVEAARAEFSVTAKTTRVTLEGENLKQKFEKEVKTTTVFAQSEELEIVETPLREPLYGARIALSQLAPDLKPKQALAVSGKRAQVIVTAKSVRWVPTDGSNPVMLQPGEVLSVMAPPRQVSGSGGQSMALTPEQLVEVLDSSPPETIQWQLMDRDGSTGSVTEPSNLIKLHTAADDDPIVNEIAFIGTPAGAVSSTREGTIITLREPLQNCYDRATVAICANVAAATHGETKNEVLGSGNASQPFQQFALKQSPLTYIRSTSPSGADSTLEVRVNDVRWQEVPTLYGHGRNERIYSTLRDDAGSTTIEFGDGLRGARLPTGQENVTATYRKGLGTNGNVKAGQLSLLMSRPLGVKGVTNPIAAEGGDDRESLANARQNAPRTVLTFDRVVSLQDYEDFSGGYAGIAKALATWTWDGRTRGVFITVAGPLGAAISDALAQDLITAIHNAGDPFVPVRVESYAEALFRLSGQVMINHDYESEKVLAAAIESLRTEFSFENRRFGQPIVLSEVIALVQAIEGVIAVDINQLYRTGNVAILNARLEAALPNGGDPASLGAGELLILDPAPIDLRVLP